MAQLSIWTGMEPAVGAADAVVSYGLVWAGQMRYWGLKPLLRSKPECCAGVLGGASLPGIYGETGRSRLTVQGIENSVF